MCPSVSQWVGHGVCSSDQRPCLLLNLVSSVLMLSALVLSPASVTLVAVGVAPNLFAVMNWRGFLAQSVYISLQLLGITRQMIWHTGFTNLLGLITYGFHIIRNWLIYFLLFNDLPIFYIYLPCSTSFFSFLAGPQIVATLMKVRTLDAINFNPKIS